MDVRQNVSALKVYISLPSELDGRYSMEVGQNVSALKVYKRLPSELDGRYSIDVRQNVSAVTKVKLYIFLSPAPTG